jgi:hypothetical protein
MGITYRQSNGARLTVQQMDDNFHYLEEQLAGLTQSNSDRLINNNLEAVLDTKGTLNTPLLIPTSFTAVCDSDHMIDTYEFTDNNWWQFEVSFQVNPDGVVETMMNNIFPILTNPGYVTGNSFRFTEQDHGIADFIFDIQLNNVVLPGGAGWTANLSVTQPPEYPSTIKSLGAVKITANDKNLTFGTDGSLTFPDYSVQTTAYTGPQYKLYTALLSQSGTASPTAIVLENTLGVIVTFSYVSIGLYSLQAVGALTINKTFVTFNSPNGNGQTVANLNKSIDGFLITTRNGIGNTIDDVLDLTEIEIRVYN